MKNAIDWIKTNPIVTACAVVSLLSLLVIGYFYVVVAPKASAEKSEILKVQQQRQRALQNVYVPVPNEDPNAPADDYNVVINQVVINEIGGIYRKIQTQYDEILGNAKTKNSQNHAQVLLGGSSIWPDANPTQFFDLYVRAASDYKDHFKAVFDARNANNWNMPSMVASSPPTQAELEQILAQSAYDYISSVGAQAASDLSQAQADQLYAEQRMKLMEALNERARSIHLYAKLPAEEDLFAPKEIDTDSPRPAAARPGNLFGGGAPVGGQAKEDAPGYPFHIADWAFSEQPPRPDQLWEGQVQLWILRDIMWTIHQVNRVGRNDIKAMGPDGVIREEPASVVNSPIKRLLDLKTLHGYVGMHNTGAAIGDTLSDAAFGPSGGGAIANPSPGAGFGGNNANTAQPSIYPAPPTELIEILKPKEVTARATEHFGITPTGRVSNSVFDVRHTMLTIDIEAGKLPAFIEALNKTNFMTVVKSEITDLDEYALLREGYVYGHADVVRAELIIESLWFRNWTEALMPKIVKEKLLIILPEPDPAAQQFGQEPF